MKLSAALIYIERNALRERIQEYSFHMTVCRCKRVFRHFVKRCPLLHPALTPRVGILYLWYTKKSFPVTGSRPVRMCAVLFKEGHCYWQLPPPTQHQLEMYRNKKKKKKDEKMPWTISSSSTKLWSDSRFCTIQHSSQKYHLACVNTFFKTEVVACLNT